MNFVCHWNVSLAGLCSRARVGLNWPKKHQVIIKKLLDGHLADKRRLPPRMRSPRWVSLIAGNNVGYGSLAQSVAPPSSLCRSRSQPLYRKWIKPTLTNASNACHLYPHNHLRMTSKITVTRTNSLCSSAPQLFMMSDVFPPAQPLLTLN